MQFLKYGKTIRVQLMNQLNIFLKWTLHGLLENLKRVLGFTKRYSLEIFFTLK